jgi:conjugal transfer pilus assembly protein TraA
MKISKLLGKVSVFAGLASTAVLAHAGTVESSDSFYDYYNTINTWATGGLGVGLATTMLVMGGAIGVAKNSPMPTLTGVAGAAFLHFGPSIIKNIMLNGYSF